MSRFPNCPFQLRDVKRLGITEHELRAALEAGILRTILYGVYGPADLPDDPEVRAAAAMLVLPEHTVVADHGAAWLHGVDAYDPWALDVPPRLDVVSIDGHDRVRRTGILGGKRDLREEDLRVVNGILVTTPLRTAADLACRRGRYGAFAVLEAFMRLHGLTTDDYQRMARRFVGRRGVTQFRSLIPLASPDAESMGESWTKLAMAAAGIPPATQQHWVELEGLGRVRLDFAYPRLRICVEYDGEEFHTEDSDVEYDESRRAALRRAGWVVIVVRKHQFTGPALDAWLTDLRQALAERTPDRRVYARAEREHTGGRPGRRTRR